MAICILHFYLFLCATKNSPYIETDEVGPQGVYGETKLSGERVLADGMRTQSIIIRTSWLYSEYGDNFLKTMLRLGRELDTLQVVFDQIGTPTYAKDLARAIMTIIESKRFRNFGIESNIFHFSNEGLGSWYDFVKTIFELKNINCNVHPIETKDYPTPASRPHYSVMNKSKIKKEFNLNIPYWKDGLQECLSELDKQA